MQDEEIPTLDIKLTDISIINFNHYYVYFYCDINVHKKDAVYYLSNFDYGDYIHSKHFAVDSSYCESFRKEKIYYFTDFLGDASNVIGYGDSYTCLQAFRNVYCMVIQGFI